MVGNAYWKKRQARLMYGRMDDSEVVARSVARIYAKASEEITQQMRDIFRVYKDKWVLTEKEAKRLLSVMDDGFFNPESLRRGINTIVDVDLRNQMLRDLETPAYQARLRRLQELQDQIDQMMVDVYKQDKQRQTEHYINTGTDTYYRGIYDVQRQVGFQFSFAHIDQKAFDRLLKSKWSGQNYSTRIWENTQHVANTVKEELMLEMLTGKALDDCAESIQNRFQVGAFQSRRIIRTESNFVSGQMQQKAYEECGADWYEYVATLDSKTDEECGALDGKRFKCSEAQPGVNMNPMHPFCRCTTIIALDQKVKEGLERRARDPKTGASKKVPASTNYIQWAKDNGLQVNKKIIGGNNSKEQKKENGETVENKRDVGIIKPDKIISGHSGTPKEAERNSIIDHVGTDGKTETRTFYGENALKQKDITTHDHKLPKQHPFGRHGEHAHDYEWNEDGTLKNRTTRELTEKERKENDDIL